MFICEMWLFDWYFPQFCTSEVRISRSVSEGPFDFEITRVDCILCFRFSKMYFCQRVKGLFELLRNCTRFTLKKVV